MKYHNLITIILGLILTCAYTVTSQAAPCIPDDINQLCNDILPPSPPRKQRPPSVAKITNADIQIKYFYSGPDGKGQNNKLENNSTLRTGDRFTIHINVNKDMYLYVFHFDSTGKEITELMKYSKLDNRVTAGSSFILPKQNRYFYLDDKVGTENIHTIVSPYPLPDLISRYRLSMLTSQQLEQTRGIGSGGANDSQDCLAGEACRDTMIINHIAR
ncbi:hypothetical protein TI05_03580 [Achromatium sp. WMS3]|nr:hypothetical protein TI05_03580 [Achromatium sp. WMS3]